MRSIRWIVGFSLVALISLVMVRSARAEDAAPAAAPTPPAAGAGAAVAPGMELSKEAAAAAKGKEAPSMNLVAVVLHSGWFGILIWLGLIASSIISVALTVDSFINISPKKIAPGILESQVREAMDHGDVLKAMQKCEEHPCPLARILSAGFSNVKEGFEVIQDSISVAADMEGEKMLQRVTYLSVIANTTPMLGLIGTVQGMIFAFFTLGSTQAGAAQQSMLAVNISHGLWATAIGLGTAVPATIFFYFFKNKATRIILGMEALTLDLIKVLRNVEVVEE